MSRGDEPDSLAPRSVRRPPSGRELLRTLHAVSLGVALGLALAGIRRGPMGRPR